MIDIPQAFDYIPSKRVGARENATGSRVYGVVNVKDTLGKVIVILRRCNF